MAWLYEISQAIIDYYKQEFLLKGRAAEFDVADCVLAIERALDASPESPAHRNCTADGKHSPECVLEQLQNK